MTTDWSSLLSTKRNVMVVSNFANGSISGRQFYSKFANTENGGTARTCCVSMAFLKPELLPARHCPVGRLQISRSFLKC